MESNRHQNALEQARFPKHSSSKGALSDCSAEARSSHSVAEGDVHEEASLGVVQVADSGAAVAVAQGHVRGVGRPPFALLGYQLVLLFAVVGAVVAGFALVAFCFHSCC